jgi:hypothetical protein
MLLIGEQLTGLKAFTRCRDQLSPGGGSSVSPSW